MDLSIARHLIGDAWEDGTQQHPVSDPGDGSVVGHLASGTAEDAVRAADAAARAFDFWSARPARDRSRVLSAAADLIEDRRGELAQTLAREGGKRLPEAIGEISFSAEYFRWFAEQARRPDGDVIPGETSARRHMTIRRPAGVVASLTPWNFPCSIQARKLAPALAAGCTVVARVSEKAPLAVTGLVETLRDAGVPAGAVNLVHGPAREVTQALLDHPAVRIVSFTGSTGVGSQIMASAARRVVRPLLELGGDAPFVVFDDADLEAAVEGAVVAKFRNTGQSCIAANRFLVHESVAEQFVDAVSRRIGAMQVGHGLADPVPDLGPVIDADRADAVNAMVAEALDAGARRLTPDVAVPTNGAYVAPALFGDVPQHAALATQEVFGPVAAVSTFRDEAEALRRANSTEMGLAGYFWSRDVGRCWRFAERLEVGIIGVNDALPSVAFAPMGGVKQSGLGREGAEVGLHEFQDVRYLCVAV